MTAAEKQEQTIQDLVAEAIANGDGDPKAAVDFMAARVREDRGLRDMLTDPLIEDACYQHIRSVYQRERKAIWTAPNYTKGGNGDRVVSLAQGNSEMLLDYRLPIAGQPRLRESTGSQIEEARSFYDQRAKDMATKAKWLGHVAEKVPEQDIAEKHVTEEQLQELREVASNE